MSSRNRGRERHERRDRNDRLRAVLKQGDPAADDGAPSSAERAVHRGRIVDAARASSAPAWRSVPLTASALIVVLVLAAAALFRLAPTFKDGAALVADRVTTQPGPPFGAGNGTTTDGNPTDPPSVRNIQFITKSGTRIVWVLNRDLDI
jgi:hypothetical protein